MALYMDSYTNVKITVSVCIKSKKKSINYQLYSTKAHVHLIKSWENVLPVLIAFYYKSLSHSLNELRFPIKCRK